MKGNTAVISLVAFRADWLTHMPISALCERYSVSKDQIIRLRDHWSLPKRHDRSVRHKPKREPRVSAAEEAASLASLELAPWVAARVTCVQIHWTPREWHERQVQKPVGFSLQVCETPPDTFDFLDAWNREVER